LILAALKDRDIAARGSDADGCIDDSSIISLLQSMVKQRRESINMYEKGGRLELAEQEADEIAIIEKFLPKQMSEEEIQTVLLAFQETIKTKLAEIDKQQAEVASEANKLYLDANAAKDGVKTTESGIQYRILTPGTGKNPLATDTVKVNYKGSLINGEEFDSSYKRGEPAEFALNGVIPGWTEGLQLIKVGGKIELVLPPELAYGTRALPSIPANSILVFEVELLEITQAKETKADK